MTEPSHDDEITKAAQAINDMADGQQFNAVCVQAAEHKTLQALQTINQITQHIRMQSEATGLQMQKGDHWAHLEIIDKIGMGGIGEVYCAYDPILDSQVAVKFLNKKSQLYISQKQFLDEARHMATVRHPHVLAIHGATVSGGIAGYWSDYLNGQLLSNQLQAAPLNWQDLLNCAKQLSHALTTIHRQQLIHGDIKANNIIMQPNRGAILLDFGSSRKHNINTNQTLIHQASPMAMAPEQFAGQLATTATDIFALGLVLWQLSARQHPLENLTLDEIKHLINQPSKWQPRLQGPRAWQQLVRAMVNPDSSQRPNIELVVKTLNHISSSPARRAKQIATASLLVLATGITLIASYSNYKTAQAQQETEAMNTILSDILMKSSPIADGKDVLLVDVLTDAETALLNNQQISAQQRSESLLQLVRTYRHQGKHQMSIDLATKLLSDPGLSDSHRLDLLMQKSAGLNENKNYEESKALLLEAIKIKPINNQDATVQLSAIITLIYTYNESYELDKVPPLIAQAKTLWHLSDKKEAALANIYLVEGNYFEIKEQYPKAREFYLLAVKNFTLFYGAKNLDVLIAEGAAATVLTYQDSTLHEGISELVTVIDKMSDFLGDAHSSTLIARINLADAYNQTGQHQLAINAIVPYMKFVYEAYGESGGMTLMFKNMIAGYYQAGGNPSKAQSEFEEIIQLQSNKHGPFSEQLIEAKLNLVVFHAEVKQLTEGRAQVTQIQATAAKNLPTDHRLRLDIDEYALWIRFLQGDKSTVPLMEDLISIKTAVFGPEDPSTLSAKQHLQQMQ